MSVDARYWDRDFETRPWAWIESWQAQQVAMMLETLPQRSELYRDRLATAGPDGPDLLEAVSLLAPGRGLRGAALSDMARQGGAGGFAVAAKLGDIDIGTGTQPSAPERRQVGSLERLQRSLPPRSSLMVRDVRDEVADGPDLVQIGRQKQLSYVGYP